MRLLDTVISVWDQILHELSLSRARQQTRAL